MSPRSPAIVAADAATSPSVTSDGDILSGDEEKAISSTARKLKDSKVNKSLRPEQGSSSRASQAQRALQSLSSDMGYHFGESAPAGRDALHSRDRSRSPFRQDRARSRSPFRAGNVVSGQKRRREDDHDAVKNAPDPRKFKVHYDDGVPSRARPHRSHVDLGRHGIAPLSHDQRDVRDDRSRNRSRSPYRRGKLEHAKDLKSHPQRDSIPRAVRGNDDAKINGSPSQQLQPAAQDRSQVQLSTSAMEDVQQNNQGKLSEAEIIEQRRKRREAIKAKHKAQPALLVQALEHTMPSAPDYPAHDSSGPVSQQQSPPSSINSPQTPHRDSPPDSPAAAAFSVGHDEELVGRHDSDDATHDQGPSAADYDDIDMDEDRPDHKKAESALPPFVRPSTEAPPNKPSKDFDMFADEDNDDMFADADTTTNQPSVISTKAAKTLDQSLLDNWDYPDGHYRIILGELLDNRYAVQQQIGKGTFATVVRALDTTTNTTIAVKIACANATMLKAAQREMEMLRILNGADVDDKRHVIRLLRHFEHKGHLCLVFEHLSADLRDVLKKFGRNVGLNLKAIRSYAAQMFLALGHFRKCGILHADLKPDNILVSASRSVLKVCDLGTAALAQDAELTPYLVSRFYRAPEVILGIAPYDYAIDMWSIGCTLFELYTGRILFAGADNNQMLRAMQECRGKFPMRMLRRAELAGRHFDAEGTFFSQERDKLTGKTVVRQMTFLKAVPGKDLRSRLTGATSNSGSGNGGKMVTQEEVGERVAFVDLMERCLQLDPARRITPAEALRCAFIAHAGPASGLQHLSLSALQEGGKQGKAEGKPRVVPAMPAVGLVGRGR